MKIFVAIFLSFISFHAQADENLVFSAYDNSIKQVAAKDNFDAQFKGEVKITGMLLVDFERDEAYFFPNEKSIQKLPNVVQGSHPKKAETIFIGAGRKLLNKILTKQAILSLLGESSFESAATVTIKNFRTEVACDAREYEADIVSVTLIPKETEVIKTGYGC